MPRVSRPAAERGRRTRRLAVAAAVATGALTAAELAYARRRRVADGPLAARETLAVVREGYRAGSADETAVLNLFLGFGTTFALARAVTHSIRRGVGPWRDVRIAQRHIHHFVPGILLVLVTGGVAISVRHEHVDPWLGAPFGAGAALIVDETALLLELQDVYWSEKGVLSVDVGLGSLTSLACLTLLVRLFRRGEAAVRATP